MGLFGKGKEMKGVATHPPGLDEFNQVVANSGGKRIIITTYDTKRASELYDQRLNIEARRLKLRAADIRNEALASTFGPEGADYINKLNSIPDAELVKLVDGNK